MTRYTQLYYVDIQHITYISYNILQIFLALPVFNKEEEECETDFERWIYTLKNMDTLKRMPFKARKAVFEKLEEIADVSSLNQEEHELYWKSINAYRTALSIQEASKEEGREEGREEGKRLQTLAIARTMKQNNMSPSVIAQSTGLSAEEIEAL